MTFAAKEKRLETGERKEVIEPQIVSLRTPVKETNVWSESASDSGGPILLKIAQQPNQEF